MQNLFILHLPMNDPEEIIHYNETMINKVDQKLIFPFIGDDLKKKLIFDFDDFPVPTWRLLNTQSNKFKFDKIKDGDEILIVEGDIIKFLGKICSKIENDNLADVLWKNFEKKNKEKWSLIFFISALTPINLAFSELSKLFGFGEDWIPDGLSVISQAKLKEFNSNNESLYRVLKRIKDEE